MIKEYREPTLDEKDVLKPDLKSFVKERISEAKGAIQKTESDLKQLVSEIIAKPQQTIEESRELLRGYGDWIKSKTESLEKVLENTVRQTVKVFSPIQPLLKTMDELEARTERLTQEVEKLISEKEKKTPPVN